MSRRRRPTYLATIESLETRQVLSTSATGAIVSATGVFAQRTLLRGGGAVLLRDADGSLVRVRLEGPGTGYLTLTNGRRSGGDLASIVLKNTNASTRLDIRTSGGRTAGTRLGTLRIERGLRGNGRLGALEAATVDLADQARIEGRGDVGSIRLRSIGRDAAVNVPGRLDRFDVGIVGSSFDLVTARLGRFAAVAVASAASVDVADRIDRIDVQKAIGVGTQIRAGGGGIGTVAAGMVDATTIESGGSIDAMLVQSVGANTLVKAAGRVGSVQAGAVGHSFDLVARQLGTLRADSLAGAATVDVSDRIDWIEVVGTVGAGSLIRAGAGGLGTFVAGSLDVSTIQVRGNAELIDAQTVGPNSLVDVGGRLERFQAGAVGHSFDLVARELGQFSASSMVAGYLDVADRVDRVEVLETVGGGSQIRVGAGGLGAFRAGALDASLLLVRGEIGTVEVRGDMRASSIVSHVDPGHDGQYGTDDDESMSGLPFFGGIASVTIGGQLTGRANTDQRFGIVAYGDLGPVRVSGKVIGGNNVRGFSEDRRVAIAGAPFPDVVLGDPPAFRVKDFMGWTDTAKDYDGSPVAYASSGDWESLKVINYEPSHYVNVAPDGTLWFTKDNQRSEQLNDTTFHDNLAREMPDAAKKSPYLSYLQGNPQITVYNDLKQLQHAGFDGVRLYASPPGVYVATILAANQLAQDTGKPFYVEYEVAAPNLSTNYVAGSRMDRINALYNDLTSADDPEGSLQTLHYVINVVTPEVFSKVVPLVFFTHENLVQPKGSPSKITDDNSSVPLLRWGINAVRDVLKEELEGQSKLPGVTTALLAGHAVQVSLDVHPAVETLIDVIQVDANSPVAYDVYPFQWANRYFNTDHELINDGKNIIDDAYPVPPGGTLRYTDRTVLGTDTDGKEIDWETGAPPIAPVFPVSATVTGHDPAQPTKPILEWSLQWMVDRINWIWGHLNQGKDTTKQLIAETGWASAQTYTDKEADDGSALGRILTGNFDDAKAYYQTIAGLGFEVDNVPVMYFSAYDEPAKTSNAHPNMFSENHYGIFTWSGIPKFTTDDDMHPLTGPFGIMSMAPFFVDGSPLKEPGTNDADTAYTISIRGKRQFDVPWYWGGTTWSDGATKRITKIPNPEIVLSDGDIVDITPIHFTPPPDGSSPGKLSVKYDWASNSLVKLSDFAFSIDSPNANPVGSKFTLNTSFDWYHTDNDWNVPGKYIPVYQDWWAKRKTT